jgi:hypothetical protein
MAATIPFPNRGFLAILAVAALLAMMSHRAKAQVTVDLSIKRNLYVAYEPLLATVRVSNLSGNRLLLADVEGKKWFGFQIETLDGRPIPPTDPNYEIDPIEVGSGESITRTVNLTQLYPLSDFGSYRVRASVYAAELGGYFSSPPLTVEITEGRLIWQQTVGVPGMGGGPEPRGSSACFRTGCRSAPTSTCVSRTGPPGLSTAPTALVTTLPSASPK